MSEDPIKDALKMMPYGFYAITSHSGDDVNAMSANWLTQVSFEPRLVALGLQKDCYTHGLVESGRVFAINIFRAEDQERIKPFTKSRAKNPDKMKEASFEPAPETGCPILEGAAAVIECRVHQIVDTGGDHDIIVGEVVAAQVFKPGDKGDSLTLMDIGWSYAG
jgi:flavin reductase (DIM6/NTAB) family NADH-FMN oxidoreductase RutF